MVCRRKRNCKKRLKKDKDIVRLDNVRLVYYLTDQDITIHSHQMKAFCAP